MNQNDHHSGIMKVIKIVIDLYCINICSAAGKVYKGEVNAGIAGEVPLLVAIKALKENATPKTQADFRREVELMTDLRHPNIVCLLGVVMKGEPLCMLFEYMTQVCL
jgi:receptor tyrosine kinase-like orphan receptor 1